MIILKWVAGKWRYVLVAVVALGAGLAGGRAGSRTPSAAPPAVSDTTVEHDKVEITTPTPPTVKCEPNIQVRYVPAPAESAPGTCPTVEVEVKSPASATGGTVAVADTHAETHDVTVSKPQPVDERRIRVGASINVPISGQPFTPSALGLELDYRPAPIVTLGLRGRPLGPDKEVGIAVGINF